MSRQSIPRRQPRLKYQSFFNGYFYYCYNFGHKATNYVFRSMQMNMSNNNQLLQHRGRQSMSKQESYTTQFTTRRRIHDKNINPFDLLYNEPECYA